MQTTSELYKELLHIGAPFEWRLIINGETVLDGEAIFDGGISGALFASSTPSVGGCVSREIDLDLLPADTVIPRMAEFHLEFRLVYGEKASEWKSAGVFFIDTRSWDAQHEMISIRGYDAMLKGEKQFIPTGEDSGTWPRTQQDVAKEIAAQMGVELDERCNINAAYTVDYPSNYTRREILGFIAASHCGNWIITPAGKLLLVPLVPAGEPLVVNEMADLEQIPEFDAWTGVQFWFDDKDTYSAGDNTGRVLEIECPWATQEMADNALSMIQGHIYRPYTAQGAIIDPAAELGDAVTVYGIESILATQDIPLGDAVCADISAPADAEIDHEYPYESPSARQTKRDIAKATASINVGVDEIRAAVEDTNGNVAALDVKVDGIKMEVSQTTASDGKVYSSIELTVGGNTYTGMILMEGNLNVSGQLSADALYAAKGDIADLAVDKLSTSRRIVKYLAGDTGDDNYIRAEEETLAFVSGVYAGGTEQATTPEGLPLYWEQDIGGATLGTDGYPYVGGVRVFTTTGATAWPVTVYTYTELVKARMAFDVVDGYYTPVLTLGAGDGNGNNIGRMMKSVDGLSLLYTAAGGKEIGVKMSNDGYTEIIGQRAVTAIAVTEGADGSVTVVNTLEGDVTETIVITPDDNGNPKTLTYNGTVIPITWTGASA